MQDRAQSHDLGTRGDTQPISCNLYAQEFEDLQTCYAHDRLTHLLFPSPTIRESRHAHPTRQPRRHRQDSRDGHEQEPRVHREGRQPRRGSAKAASTNRQPNQAATRRDQLLDDSGTQAQGRRSSRRVSTRSCSRPSSRRIRRMRDLSTTVWDTLLIKASSSKRDNMQKQTLTYAEKVRQEDAGTNEGHPSSGLTWAWSSLSSRGAAQWERERRRA